MQPLGKGLVYFCGLVTGILLSMMLTYQRVLLSEKDGVVRIGVAQSQSRDDNSTSLGEDGSGPARAGSPLPHEDVERLDREIVEPPNISDVQMHTDDNSEAVRLAQRVRVCCWVMTTADNKKKANIVKATWAGRCNRHFFMSETEDRDLPAIGLNVSTGRDHLTAKTMKAFQYIYRNHLYDCDWTLKADDDTYVIVENLRYMLSAYSPGKPIFFGHHFKVVVQPQGYFSGGGGYVISKEALRRFGERHAIDCDHQDGGPEDAVFGQCMQNLGVKAGDSRDKLGRSRFHCFNPETHLHGGYPDWYLDYDKYGAKHGMADVSDYSVTFHYVSVQQMYDLEFYTYHLRPFGLKTMPQDLNPPRDLG